MTHLIRNYNWIIEVILMERRPNYTGHTTDGKSNASLIEINRQPHIQLPVAGLEKYCF